MLRYAFDLEVFKNLFTATFVNVDNEEDIHVFYTGLNKPMYQDILDFLKQSMTLIGYNCDNFDNPILRYLITYKGNKLTSDIYELSSKLMDDNFKNDRTVLELRYPKKVIFPWKTIDLMRILAFDKLGISLKQTAINLKWHKIKDLPVSPYENVNANHLGIVLDYNMNDVLITKRLFEEISPLIKLREELSKLYFVDLTSASDSRMANIILENTYSNELKMDIRSIKDMRTIRERVLLGDCIAKFVNFKTVELQDLYDRIATKVVYKYEKYVYSEKLYFANCIFDLGIGGLHSEDAPGIFVTDDKYIIQDMDVSSYYPNLIINNNFYPEHLGPDFIKVLKKITAERIAAKKAGDKVKADGLKITANSIFGKFGLEYYWLFDAKQLLSTTITGQLGLLMLIEELYLNGIDVISCNTDGIVCKIPRELESRYYEIAKEWEKKTNLELEFTRYKKYVRRDVNSYITEKEDGSTKEKGAFYKEVDLKKSYRMPIVAKALHAYFIKGIPVRETLENCKDIMEFCISQKNAANFFLFLHTIKGMEKLQKTNRFYISKHGGSFIKKDTVSGRLTGLYVGQTIKILNEYDPKIPFESYEVSLSFYEQEVMKIIDEIEPKQLSLFDLSVKYDSHIAKMKISPPVPIINEENVSFNELDKLGKNQLLRRVESIVTNRQTVKGVNPRYVYIINFDSRSMAATMYCLAKGSEHTYKIDKSAYKNIRIEKGQILYCAKFIKLEDNDYSLVEYKIVDKLEKDKDLLI